jgi:hypothetical protein
VPGPSELGTPGIDQRSHPCRGRGGARSGQDGERADEHAAGIDEPLHRIATSVTNEVARSTRYRSAALGSRRTLRRTGWGTGRLSPSAPSTSRRAVACSASSIQASASRDSIAMIDAAVPVAGPATTMQLPSPNRCTPPRVRWKYHSRDPRGAAPRPRSSRRSWCARRGARGSRGLGSRCRADG